ncbi:MAG TPA: hypothetical protein VKG66_03670 [Steroidobacteraceae bacterium]|nr:hypothetical protein [Steroidobacteraceae bacterium]
MIKLPPRRLQLYAIAVALCVTRLLDACSGGGSAQVLPAPAPTPVAGTATFVPYQDMSLTGMSAGVQQNDLPLIAAASGITHFSMAFITSAGNACNPEWGGVGPLSGDTTFTGYVSQLRQRGGDVIISFGGEAGDNLSADGGGPDYDLAWKGGCTSVANLQIAYQAVIDRYSVNRATPVSLDFDVEGDALANPTVSGVNTIDLRNQALAALAAANPGLKISYTLPAAENCLQAPEVSLLQSAMNYGVPVTVVNVMMMDFGAPIGQGQYGAVITAAVNDCQTQLHSLGMNAALGITVLIGTNDESGETFLLSDAQTVATYARGQSSIKRLAFWEVSRDNGSCGSAPADLDDVNCSSISQSNWAFSQIFLAN